MTEKGYKGGLVARIKNKKTGKRYIVSTSLEIGKDYWSSSIFPAFFFGIFPVITKNIYAAIRNNKDDAYLAHEQMKDVVANFAEDIWLYNLPNEKPKEGFTEQAKEILRQKGLSDEEISR